MNVYEFINSKDVRRHCEEIGHGFNSMETAFLIYQSDHHTLKEKHAAWNELIWTMPDMMIEERCNCPRLESLHRFLETYMTLEQRLIEEFLTDRSDAVYRMDSTYTASRDCLFRGWIKNYPAQYEGEQLYRNFSECVEHEKMNDAEEKVLFYRVTKKYLFHREADKQREDTVLVLDGDMEILNIESDWCFLSEEENRLRNAFDGMWIDVPTPFHAGDLVFTNDTRRGYKIQPFVLTNLANDKDTDSGKRRVKSLLAQGDASDMTAYGYRIDEDGEIYLECDHDYLSVEYYEGELQGYTRTLYAVSAFLKRDDVGLQSVMNSYLHVLTDEKWKQQRRTLNWDLGHVGIAKRDEDIETIRIRKG